MMSDVIRQETIVFFLSVLHGLGLIFVYDLLPGAAEGRSARDFCSFRRGLFLLDRCGDF